MRSKKEIQEAIRKCCYHEDKLTNELLLDIRELLKQKK